MKTTKKANLALFFGVILSACAIVRAEETVTTNRFDPTIKMVKREFRRSLITSTSKANYLLLEMGGQRKSIPVDLSANVYDLERQRGSAKSVVQLVEFQIQSKSDVPFIWFCWESENANPHDFKLLTTSAGTTYASYASMDGLKLFRVGETAGSETARQMFLAKGSGPGALPPLRTGVLYAAFGKEPFFTTNALWDEITVDEVSENSGELRVILHGNKPIPQFTLTLKKGVWEKIEN